MLNEAGVQVLLGGGQDAASVTTTAAKAGGFEARFFHKVASPHFTKHTKVVTWLG